MGKINRHDSATAIPLLEKAIDSLSKGQGNLEKKVVDIGNDVDSRQVYTLDIYASHGNQIKGAVQYTTIRACLYHWGEDVTDQTSETYFRWTRVSGDTASDNTWNANHINGTKSIALTKEDVGDQATFICTVDDNDKLFVQSQIVINSNFKLEEVTLETSNVTQSMEEIRTKAESAKRLATDAETKANEVAGQLTTVNSELEALDGSVADVVGELETLSQTMSATYATKGELTSAETSLRSNISQNAGSISQAVERISAIEIDSSSALQSAIDAQALADEAQALADEAMATYQALQQQGGATAEQLAQALADANTAQSAADVAQQEANTARANLSLMADRIVEDKTKIAQLHDAITSQVSRTDELGTRVSTFEQTADGFTFRIQTIENDYVKQEDLPTLENGKSAYEIWLEAGNTGTLEEYLDSLKGDKGESASLLRIESSRGTVFKNDQVSTVLSAVIYHGTRRITNITELKEVFGNTAYLQWRWQRLDDDSFGLIASTDSRFGNNGFTFSLSPEDVDTKVTFMCELIV